MHPLFDDGQTQAGFVPRALTFMPFIIAAGLIMFVGVSLGAFGAHGLKETLEAAGQLETWKTAVLYQSFHGIALLALGVWRRCDQAATGSSALRTAGAAWLTGIVLFSGSLYALSLGGPRWLGPITPVGGLFFLLGWAALVVAAASMRVPPAPPRS
jgi:uncharacterized membrane protein YgdD (TMEM256/DUF423 family)